MLVERVREVDLVREKETPDLLAELERLRALVVEACDLGDRAAACTSERGRSTVRGLESRLSAVRAEVEPKA